ncbi:MAG TPA: hypothetical protein VKC34_08230, partial [Blastocatellia bacterium]|nr:hypothetical protein [Blastocatellia bacterium]
PRPRDGAGRPDDSPAWRRPDRSNGVTLQPVSGFARADKNRVRPAAPTGDLEEFVRNGARPGLPEVPASDLAAAPAWRKGQELSGRPHIVRPSVDILNRPVVTRSRPVAPSVASSAPRERRVLTPRRPLEVTETFRRSRDRGADEGGRVVLPRADRSGERSDSRARPSRPPTPDARTGDAPSNSPGRERGKGDEGESETRSRPRFNQEPVEGGQKDSNERTNERADGNREPRPPAAERRKEREERPRPDSGTSSRPKPERDSSSSNQEPRRERPAAPAPEQKQERRQENTDHAPRKKN